MERRGYAKKKPVTNSIGCTQQSDAANKSKERETERGRIQENRSFARMYLRRNSWREKKNPFEKVSGKGKSQERSGKP